MNEYRCKFCHKLLFKYSCREDLLNKIQNYRHTDLTIEIMCNKCDKINVMTHELFQDKVAALK